MRSVLLSGVRGGVGTTSVTAMLADALCGFGQRVLAVDLNSTDMLRLHFNVPYQDAHGWLAAATPQQCLSQVFQVTPGLCLAPCGLGGRQADGDAVVLAAAEPFWLAALDGLSGHFDWLVFDAPARRLAPLSQLRARMTYDFCVARPDVAAHVQLMQQGLSAPAYLLINGLNPTQRLLADVALDWRCRWGDRVLPVWVPEDAGLHEALAHKTPVTRYHSSAASSHAARSLALWCMAQREAA